MGSRREELYESAEVARERVHSASQRTARVQSGLRESALQDAATALSDARGRLRVAGSAVRSSEKREKDLGREVETVKEECSRLCLRESQRRELLETAGCALEAAQCASRAAVSAAASERVEKRRLEARVAEVETLLAEAQNTWRSEQRRVAEVADGAMKDLDAAKHETDELRRAKSRAEDRAVNADRRLAEVIDGLAKSMQQAVSDSEDAARHRFERSRLNWKEQADAALEGALSREKEQAERNNAALEAELSREREQSERNEAELREVREQSDAHLRRMDAQCANLAVDAARRQDATLSHATAQLEAANQLQATTEAQLALEKEGQVRGLEAQAEAARLQEAALRVRLEEQSAAREEAQRQALEAALLRGRLVEEQSAAREEAQRQALEAALLRGRLLEEQSAAREEAHRQALEAALRGRLEEQSAVLGALKTSAAQLEAERDAALARQQPSEEEAALLRAHVKTLESKALLLEAERDKALASVEEQARQRTAPSCEEEILRGCVVVLQTKAAELESQRDKALVTLTQATASEEETVLLRAHVKTLQGKAAVLVSERDKALEEKEQALRARQQQQQQQQQQQTASEEEETVLLRAHVKTLQSKAAALASERDKALAAVEQQAAGLREQATAHGKRVDVLESERDKALAAVEQQAAGLREHDKRVDVLESERDKARAAVEAGKGGDLTASCEEEELRERVKGLLIESTRLESERDNALVRVEEQAEEMKQIKASGEVEVALLRAHVETLQVELSEERDNNEEQTEAALARTHLKALQSEVTLLEGERDRALAAVEEQRASSEEEAALLKERLHTLQIKTTLLESERDAEVKEQEEQLREQVDALEAKAGRLETQRDRAREEASTSAEKAATSEEMRDAAEASGKAALALVKTQRDASSARADAYKEQEAQITALTASLRALKLSAKKAKLELADRLLAAEAVQAALKRSAEKASSERETVLEQTRAVLAAAEKEHSGTKKVKLERDAALSHAAAIAKEAESTITALGAANLHDRRKSRALFEKTLRAERETHQRQQRAKKKHLVEKQLPVFKAGIRALRSQATALREDLASHNRDWAAAAAQLAVLLGRTPLEAAADGTRQLARLLKDAEEPKRTEKQRLDLATRLKKEADKQSSSEHSSPARRRASPTKRRPSPTKIATNFVQQDQKAALKLLQAAQHKEIYAKRTAKSPFKLPNNNGGSLAHAPLTARRRSQVP